MRIFLTGATGFIGSNFMEAANAAGHQVVGLRLPGSHPVISLSHQPTWLDGALTDDWYQELRSCDILIHMAACGVANESDNWDRCFQVNVIDSIHLWRKAVLAGIRRFIIIGSCFEYGKAGERHERIPHDSSLEPTTAYSASKASATMAALALAVEHNLELLVLRPFHVYGPGESPNRFWPSLVKAAQHGEDFMMTPGEQVRDFQPVNETCEQILQSLNWYLQPGKPEVVNLGTGRSMSLNCFATSEWQRLNASGRLVIGAKPYRANEVMRYLPEIQSTKRDSLLESLNVLGQ